MLIAPGLLLSGCISASPHDFACGRYFEQIGGTPVLVDYPAAPLLTGLRTDGAADFAATGGDRKMMTITDYKALDDDRRRQAIDMVMAAMAGDEKMDPAAEGPSGGDYDAVLLLSGGGQWGAFGAGFLKAWQDNLAKAYREDGSGPPPGVPDITAVTGISTGALQAVFAAIGDYEGMVEAYTIARQDDVVIDRGDLGALWQGASLDTEPLRQRLKTRLCQPGEEIFPQDPASPRTFACRRLQAIASSDTTLLIGFVNGETGDLQVVNVTQLLANHYPDEQDETAEESLADCVTGVALASAAVPAQLRPVRIDDRAYVDGGVRAAVFTDLVTRAANEIPGEREVFVVRNGPTVMRPAEPSKEEGYATRISEKPTILRVGMQSYTAIVNQNEMSSLAEVARLYGQPYHFASADGFNTPGLNPEPGTCPYPRKEETDETAFNPAFMSCLIEWGRKRYDDMQWSTVREERSGADTSAPAGGE
ncbi:MAG: patatin-like phospholipase family protein [Erythrobacter sp.]|nr:patatin-like phospholipase family protein [Erythrobacter sp.]